MGRSMQIDLPLFVCNTTLIKWLTLEKGESSSNQINSHFFSLEENGIENDIIESDDSSIYVEGIVVLVTSLLLISVPLLLPESQDRFLYSYSRFCITYHELS